MTPKEKLERYEIIMLITWFSAVYYVCYLGTGQKILEAFKHTLLWNTILLSALLQDIFQPNYEGNPYKIALVLITVLSLWCGALTSFIFRLMWCLVALPSILGIAEPYYYKYKDKHKKKSDGKYHLFQNLKK